MPHSRTIISSKSFYDLIAPDYNNQLVTAQNDRIRKDVESIFTGTITEGPVLDFGGGTGLDIPWLHKHYPSVYFLEPSQMREVAKESSQKEGTHVSFLEENLDFHSWSPDNLPLQEKVNGVLANFAVLNCIEDISILLEKLPLVIKPGGYLMATVLDTRWHRMLRNYSVKDVIFSLLNRTPKTYSNHKGFGHTTYLYSLRTLKFLSKEYFYWISAEPVKGSPFVLIILKRK